MGKVLPLEGPHRKHHNHGKDASVPGKGLQRAVPNKFWEMMYSPSASSKAMKTTQGANFDPVRACDKPTTYVKVNETDH
jgi:hypothetical protein